MRSSFSPISLVFKSRLNSLFPLASKETAPKWLLLLACFKDQDATLQLRSWRPAKSVLLGIPTRNLQGNWAETKEDLAVLNSLINSTHVIKEKFLDVQWDPSNSSSSQCLVKGLGMMLITDSWTGGQPFWFYHLLIPLPKGN